MIEQNFGHKDLYEIVLKAKYPMQFGNRYVEADEPIIYFDSVNIAQLNEQSRPMFARGGWGNLPRVMWESRSEVEFSMSDGVISSIGMSLLLASNVMAKEEGKPLYINVKEGPLECSMNNVVQLKHWPVEYPEKKTFIFNYDRDNIQQKLYGRRYISPTDQEKLNKGEITIDQVVPRLEIYQDKNLSVPAEKSNSYAVDYYYKYEDEAQIYSIEQRRFSEVFVLEAKFHSKDENEGINYTNLLYMPKVRIVSNINLRLGERADPAVSNFTIIGLPETVGEKKNLIVEMTRLGWDIDADI